MTDRTLGEGLRQAYALGVDDLLIHALRHGWMSPKGIHAVERAGDEISAILRTNSVTPFHDLADLADQVPMPAIPGLDPLQTVPRETPGN